MRKFAPQRITGSDRFYFRKQAVVSLRRHAGKFKRGRCSQPQPFCFVGIMLGQRMIGKNDQVRPEQLVPLPGKRQLHPVGKKSDRSHTAHGNDERKCQHA